jgi:hypothetical protein
MRDKRHKGGSCESPLVAALWVCVRAVPDWQRLGIITPLTLGPFPKGRGMKST